MIQRALITALNRVLAANPNVTSQLRRYSGQVLLLQLLPLCLQVQITADGQLQASTAQPACSLAIPLAAASYLIDYNQHQTLQKIKISGDQGLALDFLSALSHLQFSNLLYQTPNPWLGVVASKIEHLLTQLIAYARLVISNAGLSLSHYIQYESSIVSDKYQLEQFYQEVDALAERCDRLQQRIERLIK